MPKIDPEARFEVGETVLLTLGVDAKYAPSGLKRWDGCRFEVESVHQTIVSQGQNYWYSYTLKCCRSPQGEPYTIMEEWIERTKC